MIDNLDSLKGGNVPTVSEKPWSSYKESDYTPEQWHAACLLHQHQGAPTSKNQCKLPVKTPEGTLNRAGVHAAAAALAGARGGVSASLAEKASVSKALLRLYSQLDEDPPPSLKHEQVDAFLAHYGVPGMRWGFRKSDNVGSRLKSTEKKLDEEEKDKVPSGKIQVGSVDGKITDVKTPFLSADAERFIRTQQKEGHEMSDQELKKAVERARLVKEYDKVFDPGPNAELKAKVEAMQLRKDYARLKAEMNPSKLDRVRKFVDRASAAYESYQKLDKLTGGKLSGKVNNSPASVGKVFKANPKKVKVANPGFKPPPRRSRKSTPVFKVTTMP